MSNHVSQPTAQALKDAGWEWETYWGFYQDTKGTWWPICEGGMYQVVTTHPSTFLPAPNISELRERLTRENFSDYYDEVFEIDSSLPDWRLLGDYISWIYDVTASADELAEVWLWAQGQKKGDHDETT